MRRGPSNQLAIASVVARKEGKIKIKATWEAFIIAKTTTAIPGFFNHWSHSKLDHRATTTFVYQFSSSTLGKRSRIKNTQRSN